MTDRKANVHVETKPAAPAEPRAPIPASGIIPEKLTQPGQELKHNLAIVDHFNVQGWNELLADPALDVGGIKGKVLFIEQYLGEKIREMGLKDEEATYRSLLASMETHFQFTSMHRHDVRINKIFDYLKTLEKSDKKNAKMRAFIQQANKEALAVQKETELRGFH
jgi:hypothetical protein